MYMHGPSGRYSSRHSQMLNSCDMCFWACSTVPVQPAKPVQATALTSCTSLAVWMPIGELGKSWHMW